MNLFKNKVVFKYIPEFNLRNKLFPYYFVARYLIISNKTRRQRIRNDCFSRIRNIVYLFVMKCLP